MGHHTYSPDADIAANTEVNLHGVLDGPMDLRGGKDPVEEAELKTGADFTQTDFTSTGQGEAGDPAAGEIVVTGPYTIAVGDAISSTDLLQVRVDERGEVEKKV